MVGSWKCQGYFDMTSDPSDYYFRSWGTWTFDITFEGEQMMFYSSQSSAYGGADGLAAQETALGAWFFNDLIERPHHFVYSETKDQIFHVYPNDTLDSF